MTEPLQCPKCGILLAHDAPGGLCPKCLVKAALLSEAEPEPPASNSKPALQPMLKSPAFTKTGFEPPLPEELVPLFPQLEILELIGKGGMGAVYKARQRGLDRVVAVKILPPEIGHEPSFAERFAREARALARLSHNHIVSVYDFGQVKHLFYIVMEYVDGANLRQAIQAGNIKPQAALAIVPQICEALQFAHDEGIVHRDIKPENILIDKRGRVKIADFGLAKLLGQDASDHSLTATHQVMGTLRYMSPEQMQGSHEVDHRADIYSLGVVFYELLTGDLPIGKFALPSKKVQVDARLDEIVLRALEQQPEQRYQHASEIRDDVEKVTSKPTIAPEAAVPSDDARNAEILKSKQLTPLPRFFWVYSFGMLIFCWIAVLALLNFGLPGFVLGSVVMAVVAQELFFCHARRNSCWIENWRAAAVWKRFNILCMIIPFSMSFMMLIGGISLRWNSSMPPAYSSSLSREDFEARYKGKEYQLIRRLDAFKEDVPAVELTLDGYIDGPLKMDAGPMIAWVWIAGGVMSLLVCFGCQQDPGAKSSSVWTLFCNGWRLALTCTGMVLISAGFAYAALSVVVILFPSGGSYASVQNNVVVQATTTAAYSALHRWAAENEYVDGPRYRFSLLTVPKGELVGNVDVSNVRKEPSFDRRWITFSAPERFSPDLTFQIIGSEKPVQAEVTISAGVVESGSEKQKQLQDIVQRLLDAVSKTSDIDRLNPVEIPSFKQPETHSEWQLLCGVLAAALAWIFVRARYVQVPQSRTGD